MGKLQILPSQIANMIAAGEVVQRPASVVKELMENAVDAGADQISVVVTDSGRTSIQVIDNGCGMSPSDATLCFERHATSKIATAEDLSDILTYGFRGEALASIAAVAEVTLKTRRTQDETATKVTIEDFGKVTASSVAGPVGSSFTVRNLFYNTPARRKFLKTDNVELKHIIEEFTRVAVPHPEISFTLTSNGRDIFVLKKAKSLKFRILDVLGSNVVGDIVDLKTETSVVNVSGFVGRPDAARKTLGNQFFFVCGRYFRSPYLHKAVMKAYEEMIPEGVTPSYFIFLDIDPKSIDVNIHPTKTEIKFEDDSVIFQILYACVKETLGRNSFGASIDFDTEGAVDLPQLGKSFEEYKGGIQAPQMQLDPTYDPFNFGTMAGTGRQDRDIAPDYDFSRHVTPSQNYGALFSERTLPGTRNLVLQGKYILTPVNSGVMVVNIRRARERILYERALDALAGQNHVTQTSLFPVQVQVGAAQLMLFTQNADILSRLGFDISAFGTDSVVVNGVPEGYSCEAGKVQQMVQDLALVLEDGGALEEVMRQQMASRFATLGASGADNLTDPMEAQRLIDTLFACNNAEVTPGGRRIVSIMGMDEFDKRF
ncbi:MAG: DNA mismatch repair endonuclease MutL [Bacteroidales bacterium]|nr:DNA mismatch repair endonuclease MutL [Candidatus Cryptobacteroides choladohippi]MCQ2179538.1 DNA mismatch repair endonuclease MutL [Bacteroidales bacterium]